MNKKYCVFVKLTCGSLISFKDWDEEMYDEFLSQIHTLNYASFDNELINLNHVTHVYRIEQADCEEKP